MSYIWNRKTVLFLTVFVLIFAFAFSANAFDKRRKGFILGIGLGPGYNSRTVTINSNEMITGTETYMGLSNIAVSNFTDPATILANQSYEESFSKFAFTTNFKIGYAINDQLMVYWTNSVSWFGDTEDSNYVDDFVSALDTITQDPLVVDTTVSEYIRLGESKDKKSLAIGVGGVGVTYFMNPQAPSIYFNLGAGFSHQSYPFKGTDPDVGFGVSGGIGYEFSPGWALEFVVMYAKPDGETDIRPVTYETSSIGFGLMLNILGY